MCMALALGQAAGTEPDERKVGEASLIAELLAHLDANRIELLARDRANGMARLADQVLVLGRGQRIEARPVAEMNVADEPNLLQRLEVAINGGQIGARQASLQSLRDALGRERALEIGRAHV